MKKVFVFCMMMMMFGACLEIEEINSSCTVSLNDGSVLEISRDIRINNETGTITYRDENDKLWSIFKEDYESFSCSN